MLAVIGGAVGVAVVLGTVWMVKSRRTRAMDKAMRDYVRRAY